MSKPNGKKLTKAEQQAQLQKENKAAAAKRKARRNDLVQKISKDENEVATLGTRAEVRRMLKELALGAPKAIKGSASYKVYKLFQTKDDRLLENALGIVSRHLDPYTYFGVNNFSINAFVRSILARSKFAKGLTLLGADGADKYCFVKFNSENPLAPISLLKESSKKYFYTIPSRQANEGTGCNYENDPINIQVSVAGTVGPTTPTSITPIVHAGTISGQNEGNLIALAPAANKKENYAVSATGDQIALVSDKGIKGTYGGMYPCKAGDSFGLNATCLVSTVWSMNAIFKLANGTYTYGTASTAGGAGTNISLAVVAPANAVLGLPFAWTDGVSPGSKQAISYWSFSITTSSWGWEAQYTDYADDLYEQMLQFVVNGYRFVITPENADSYKSGYTEVVRVPNRSYYVAARDPVDYWNLIRQTQGLEQRGGSMAGSGTEGEGVSGIVPSGCMIEGKMYTRTDLPIPDETTIFAFRQPSVQNGAIFQDTTMELSIEYCYQYQPKLYNQQNVAQYYKYDPVAEALAQNVLTKLKWFTCNPGHSIFETAAGMLNNAKNKLKTYNAEHPEVAPKILEALGAIGMSFM